MLRSLAATGDLDRLSALLFGRPGGHLLGPDDHEAYDAAIEGVVRGECGLDALPVVTGMDFGHTDPSWTLPIGVSCTVDVTAQSVVIEESCVI